MTTCESVRESVSAWLDGELETELEMQMMDHTSECEECRSFLEICRVMSGDLRLDPVPVPKTLIAGVMDRLAEERQAEAADQDSVRTADRRRKHRRAAVWVCAAACLALVILAGPWNWRAGSSGSKADIAVPAAGATAEAESTANGAYEPAEMADEAATDSGWASDEAKAAAVEKADMYDMDYSEATEEESTEDVAVSAEEPTDDFAPRADSAGQFLGDYAAVITVYGKIPDSVLALREREEPLSEGTAWLIPAEKADDLLLALDESAVAYEWLQGSEESSSWLLVRTEEN